MIDLDRWREMAVPGAAQHTTSASTRVFDALSSASTRVFDAA
jgi:hypothetical protein